MTRNPIRVLQIEDVEDDALLVRLELQRGGWHPNCTRVDTARAMRRALSSEVWDLVISDFDLPAFDAPSALSVLQEFGIDVPFIIVSGTITEEAAVAAMKAGAHDYVTKTNMRRLVPAVERELREAAIRRDRLRAEGERRRAEARFHTLVESLDGLAFTLSSGFHITGVFGRGLGPGALDRSMLVGKTPDEFFGGNPGAPGYDDCARAFAGEHVVREWTHEQPSGIRYWQLSMSPIVSDGVVDGLIGHIRDVTELKKMQAQLLLTDRLASIGALAASVAHEINNPLAALMANLEAVSQDLLGLSSGVGVVPAGLETVRQAKDGLADAREAGARIGQVVRDLRVVSRTSDERREPVAVERALESSIRLAWNEIRARARLSPGSAGPRL